ncbi:hypothetical protein APX81_25880 [Escherichia coli]|nr:hypothetical protein APU33_02575 [Escherichia coli]PAZ28385.1 hypothetical protein APU34_23785 [Escherichia coli]PAZ34250.1 hypothetical protein APU36_27180 [Escherichia coli]PAZ35560.1 hypothetical protein APU35_16880 [Escherichia coli]PAZ43443.1 hypothetical protein APX81_25880 [Escherichia coli]
MMSLWDALRMNMMISYQELVRTFLRRKIHNRKSWICRLIFRLRNINRSQQVQNSPCFFSFKSVR